MSEYEMIMLRLKLIELSQSQAAIALSVMVVNSVNANIVGDSSLELLNEASDMVLSALK